MRNQGCMKRIESLSVYYFANNPVWMTVTIANYGKRATSKK